MMPRPPYPGMICRRQLLAALAIGAAWPQSVKARRTDKITYLLPAPREAITLAPFLLAERQGWYRQAGLDVTFTVVPGGFNVGKALARGEGDLGGASGDTPILLRASDIPVKGIALLGRHSFLTLITRQDSPASSGRYAGTRIDVPSLRDTSYYAVQELAARSPHGSQAIESRPRPPADLITDLASGQIDGFVGTVDWGVKAERAGARLHYRKLDGFYPAMAQAIMASDAAIAKRPAILRRFIRATLQALAHIALDPERAATVYETAIPDSGFTHAEIVRVFGLLASEVYGAPAPVGHFAVETVLAAESELLKRNLITQRRAPKEYCTNRLSIRQALTLPTG